MIMLIHNKNELNTVLLQKTRNAVIKAQEQVYAVVNRFVKEYYAEYDPIEYVRTYQFYQSLVKSEITPADNGQLGWKARVYFDLDKLDYYMKTTRSKGTKVNDMQNFDDPLDQKGVMSRVMKGLHVVKPHIVQGTPIWDETRKFLDEQGFNLLKRMLQTEGVLIK